MRRPAVTGVEEWRFAAVRSAVVGGRVFGAGLFSNLDDDTTFLEHGATAGELLGSGG